MDKNLNCISYALASHPTAYVGISNMVGILIVINGYCYIDIYHLTMVALYTSQVTLCKVNFSIRIHRFGSSIGVVSWYFIFILFFILSQF